MMNKAILGLALLALMLIHPLVFAGQIISTYSIDSPVVKNIDKLIEKDTLVLVELDEVVVMPKSRMFSYRDNPYRLFIQNLISLSQQNSRYLPALVAWYQTRKIKLVEAGWADFINNLKKRGIAVYGFCTMPLHLQNIEQKKYLELKDLGILFTEKVNGKEIIELNRQEDWPSVFYRGIIFTGPFGKSQTLLDFIKNSNISPKKIVIFDKIKNELLIIDQKFRRFRIDFYPVLYLGARSNGDLPDPKIVLLQQKTLFDQAKWLEDEEAASPLKVN